MVFLCGQNLEKHSICSVSYGLVQTGQVVGWCFFFVLGCSYGPCEPGFIGLMLPWESLHPAVSLSNRAAKDSQHTLFHFKLFNGKLFI
jgi:hypothetical protein